jgi:deazaflavin-dependent oxidoreductase (nitroreductase family)
MLRLISIGRRTSLERRSILGYLEDGPNLVTLAMNGWADPEPAWWLNLKAHPDTQVDLVDGPRLVRARASVGEERARLWQRFGGGLWGDDLETFAARRSRETAVVVFEPRD